MAAPHASLPLAETVVSAMQTAFNTCVTIANERIQDLREDKDRLGQELAAAQAETQKQKEASLACHQDLENSKAENTDLRVQNETLKAQKAELEQKMAQEYSTMKEKLETEVRLLKKSAWILPWADVLDPHPKTKLKLNKLIEDLKNGPPDRFYVHVSEKPQYRAHRRSAEREGASRASYHPYDRRSRPEAFDPPPLHPQAPAAQPHARHPQSPIEVD